MWWPPPPPPPPTLSLGATQWDNKQMTDKEWFAKSKTSKINKPLCCAAGELAQWAGLAVLIQVNCRQISPGWHTYSCNNTERAVEWLAHRPACTVSRHGPTRALLLLVTPHTADLTWGMYVYVRMCVWCIYAANQRKTWAERVLCSRGQREGIGQGFL